MNLLLAFAPFLVFAVVDHWLGSSTGLASAALVSGILLVRDWFTPGKTPKVLEIGTFLLFGSLAALSLRAGAAWSVLGVRLRVDVGLIIIVLVSIAIRRPFTLQYAREQVPQELWSNAVFIRTNYMITAAWGLAFAAMILADLVMLDAPRVPKGAGIAVTVAALLGALKFTRWYPERVRSEHDR